MEYVKRKEATKTLGICYKTLYKIAKNKEIDTIKVGSNTLYNVKKYLLNKEVTINNKKNICYCRVSSSKQKNDLQRQIEFMKNKYPGYEIISDIGSGLNYNRVGLKLIIDKSINGEINELVIAYKDRLTRFGFEMIENIIKKYSNGKITMINKEEMQSPMEELSKDILSIMNVYVAKINGLRNYKIKLNNNLNKNNE